MYVSATWNSYRKCRFLLLDLISNCSQRLHEIDPTEPYFSLKHYIQKEVGDLCESLGASIPFHLIRNLETFLNRQPQQTSSPERPVIIPNRSAGGLLLMHPIHIVSGLSIVPIHFRKMLKEQLAWIGRVMGIGQARLLATDVNLATDVSICPCVAYRLDWSIYCGALNPCNEM